MKLADKVLVDKIIEVNLPKLLEIKENNRESYDLLYKAGKAIHDKTTLIEKNKNFDYLSWTAYEYILRKIDFNHFFWISYADEFRVEITMTWFGKEYKGSYGVEQIPLSKTSGKPIDSISEKTVNEGMRCYAKVASRVTGFMHHLWIEGGSK